MAPRLPKSAVWKGADELRQFVVPVGEIEPHPRNPRTHDLDTIAESLDRFGQLRPLIVRLEDGILRAGHGTLQAAVEKLGWTHIARIRPSLSEDDADRFLLMDNRASDRAGYETAKLAAILQDLAERGGLQGTGYTNDNLDDILGDLARRNQAPPPDGNGGGEARPRRESLGAGFTEVVLLYSDDQAAKFTNYVKMLGREYGTEGPGETVLATLERAAKSL